MVGSLDLRTGRTLIGYEARSILVFCWSGQCMNQNKSMAYKAELVLRRV
jgi:hypothetical protein